MDARGSVSDCTSAGVDRRSAIPSLLLALLTLAGAPASGDTLYWDSGGGADQSWANPANWNPGFVPRYSGNGTSAEDAAEINNGGTARVTATGYGAMELVLGRASHESGTLHLVYLAADLGEALFVEKRVFVGLFGTGMLTLRNGAKLMSDREDYVGDGAGAAGTLTVDGSGSEFFGRLLYVGSAGSGTMNVLNGGRVGHEGAFLGYYPGGTGNALVDGAGSLFDHNWDNDYSKHLYVGVSGTGTLTVQNGGRVETQGTLVGYEAGGVGTVTVLSGGYVDAGYRAALGVGVGASGTVTVDGPGSEFEMNENMQVGDYGTGTLTIQNGGLVRQSGDVELGRQAGATGAVTVDGSGSTWINSWLRVGDFGTGTMTVQNGGQVSSDYGLVGARSGAGNVTVRGAGSSWTSSAELDVGSNDPGSGGTGALTVENGGLVHVGGTMFGDGTLKLWSNGTLTLDGGTVRARTLDRTAGSFIWSSGMVHFIDNLTVDAGELFGNIISVSTNRALAATNTLTVGSAAALSVEGGTLIANTLNNTGGGDFGTTADSSVVVNALAGFGSSPSFNCHLRLGHAGGSGSSIYAVGAGQSLSATSSLTIGHDGSGTLTVFGGGDVVTAHGYVGQAGGGTGSVTVDGPDSTWTGGGVLYAGIEGAGAVTVQNGGRVDNTDGVLGYHGGATGAATVDGTGSAWANSANLYVGNFGAGTVTVRNGGYVSDIHAYLGAEGGSAGTVTVDGSGSTWANSGSLFIGGTDSLPGGTGDATVSGGARLSIGDTLKLWGGGTLTVDAGTVTADTLDRTGGGSLSDTAASSVLANRLVGFGDSVSLNGNLLLGHAGGSGSGTHAVGAGQSLSAGTTLTVGHDAPGTVLVSGGGDVVTAHGYVGQTASGTGSVTVDGPGSTWTGGGVLYAGVEGAGTVTVQNGGRIDNTDGVLGYHNGATGTAIVDGTGSTWANSADLYVGNQGTGTLTVQGGGQVNNATGHVGFADGSTGTATVDGAGSTWNNSFGVYVGGSAAAAGGTGELTVQNGGAVSVGRTLKVWNAGTVNLTGGTLRADSLENDGTVNCSGGTIEAGVTNSGTFELSGGGTRTIAGAVTNTGAFKTTGTTAEYTGAFTNSGAYVSDPSVNTFNDLIVTQAGYLVGGAGDVFNVHGDLISSSTMSADWDTADASLVFLTGTDAQPLEHDFHLNGEDQGAVATGYVDNFPWGVLEIATGNRIRLVDGGGAPGGALYAGRVAGLDILGNMVTNVASSNGLNIYYDPAQAGNAYLAGSSYLLSGGGHLVPLDGEPIPTGQNAVDPRDAEADDDGDGLSNYGEWLLGSGRTDPNSPPKVYVDSVNGNDGTGDGSAQFPYATVQKGVDEAATPGIVQIAAGTYAEHVTVGKRVALLGEGREQTVLDGQNTGRVVQVSAGAGAVVIAHCAVTHGYSVSSAGSLQHGSGIAADGVALYLNDVLVAANVLGQSDYVARGAGVYVSQGSLRLGGCSITDNTGAAQNTSEGGGLCTEDASVSISATEFRRNSAGTWGGMAIRNAPACRLVNALIDGNEGTGSGDDGAGFDSGPATLWNCTVVDQAGVGVGFAQAAGAVVNCIFRGNGTSISTTGGGVATVTYSCLPEATAGPGNIQADPLFADPASGVYCLTLGSPCVDAASGDHTTDEDFFGEPRRDNLDTPNTGVGSLPYVDMGYAEYPVGVVAVPVPTLSEWGIALLVLGLAAAATVRCRRNC